MGLNGIKTGDLLLCFNPCMLELLPFVACWWCLKVNVIQLILLFSLSHYFLYHLLFSWCCFASCTDVFTLVTTWNAENNIAQCHITVCPFVTYPLFTFLLPCFWLGNRPRKFQSWYTCNYHISSLSLDLFHFWLSPFGTYICLCMFTAWIY